MDTDEHRFENQIIQGDCLEVMREIPDKSIDLVLSDFPYNVLKSKYTKWDVKIDLKRTFKELHRITKPNGAVITTAMQPFTTKCILANYKNFKQSLVWWKSFNSGFLNAKVRPLQEHEDILIFYKEKPVYNRIRYKITDLYVNRINGINRHRTKSHDIRGNASLNYSFREDGKKQLGSVYPINNDWLEGMHSTQKPLKLYELLALQFSNPNDLILDPFLGSGTTAVAALRTGRRFIGIELSEEYCNIARKRVAEELAQPRSFEFVSTSSTNDEPKQEEAMLL